MKKQNDTPHAFRRSGRQGIVLVSVLMLLLIACFVVGSLLTYASRSIHLTNRALDSQRAFLAAEAGVEYGVMRLRDILQQYGLSKNVSRSTLQWLLDELPPPESPDDRYAYTKPDGDVAFLIKIDGDPVIDGDILEGASGGQIGTYQSFTVICGAVNPETGVASVIQQKVQAVSTFMVRYGVFYENDLEVQPGGTMTFTGKVHSNGDVYVGGSLQFNSSISAVGSFYNLRKETDARNGKTVNIKDKDGNNYNTFNSSLPNGGDWVDSLRKNWTTEAILRWDDNVKTGDHGVSRLAPPIESGDTPHDLIERPIPETSEDHNIATEDLKFSTKAALTIHVDSAGGLTATDRDGNDVTSMLAPATLKPQTGSTTKFVKSTTTGAYSFLTTQTVNGEGSYQTGNSFYDARENKTMVPVDIYLDQLLESGLDLYSGTEDETEDGSGVVYVTRDDPDPRLVVTSTTTSQQVITGYNSKKKPIYGYIDVTTYTTNSVVDQPCVRIRNASTLLAGPGLSVITDLPVYVEGNFNTQGTANGTTSIPALVAGDAVTMLSKTWQDANSALALTSRTTSDTRFNGVVMTGNTTTTTGVYNGGLENVLRFLEDWRSRTFTYSGSIICMWASEIANANWKNTGSSYNVYNVPTRVWGYDPLYLQESPPGIPRFFAVEETRWSRTTWDAFEAE